MKSNFEISKTNKKEFFELYEKAKKKEIDLHTLQPETLKKIYTILEKEMIIKKRTIAELKSKLNVS